MNSTSSSSSTIIVNTTPHHRHRRCNSATTYQQQVTQERHANNRQSSLSGSRLKRTLSLSLALTGVRTAFDQHSKSSLSSLSSVMAPIMERNRVKSILKSSRTNSATTTAIITKAITNFTTSSAPGTPIRKVFRFNEIVLVGETHSKHEYERRSDFVMYLPPNVAHAIKKELNEFKITEMEVHQESRGHTHLYLV